MPLVQANALSIEEQTYKTVDVVDTEGNLVTTVQIPESRIAITVGAAIFINGVKMLLWNGAVWVILNPDTSMQIFNAAMDTFTLVQNTIGPLIVMHFNGTTATSATKVDGNTCVKLAPNADWTCTYSL